MRFRLFVWSNVANSWLLVGSSRKLPKVPAAWDSGKLLRFRVEKRNVMTGRWDEIAVNPVVETT